jgi:hypothetical protein
MLNCRQHGETNPFTNVELDLPARCGKCAFKDGVTTIHNT